MNALFTAAAEIQNNLQHAGEKFCFIGGIALQRWGEPRLTRDVDLTLLCPFGAESPAVERLLGVFAPRMPDAREFALQHRVLLLRARSGVPIDIAFGSIPFEEHAVERASEFDFGETRLLTCSAEDLVVFKAFAGRDRDWADIESIAMRQAGHLDWTLIYNELAPLAELRGGNELIKRLQELQKS
jgi:hypothetical protein